MYWGSAIFGSSIGIARNADRACIDGHCLGAKTETDAPLRE
jgi:hypothetical protein